MMVFMFRSEVDDQVFGLTYAKDGSNLPSQFAPWHVTGNWMVPVGATPSDPVMNALTVDGYFIGRSNDVE